MKRSYHRWPSRNLGRDMELLVFGHAGERILVFPTRCGRFHDYEDWRLVEAWGNRLAAGSVQLYCLDSVDAESIYNNWCRPADRIHRHLQFERYIMEEVVPFTVAHNPDSRLSLAGCSLGAWHAVNLACRHPGIFHRVLAFSGRYDLTRTIGPYRDLFDGHYDDHVYFNMPSHYVPPMWEHRTLDPLRRLDLTITVGETDICHDNNRDFVGSLQYHQIPHRFHVWSDEAHRPRYWRRMVAEYG